MRLFVAAVLVVVAGCAPAPTGPASTSSLSSQPEPTLPLDAGLTVTASGQLSCGIGYGCGALVVIQPNPAGTSPLPVWTILPGQQVSFPELGSTSGPADIGPLAIDAPARIAPGSYHVAGVINLISDVSSPVTTPVPIRVVPTCLADLSVAAGTSVRIAVKFAAAGGCSIKTSAVAEAPQPSSYPLGIVPPESMSVSVSNSTTLYVNLYVNGTFMTTLDPGACVGCHGDDAVPAFVLPPLPWNVEVRTLGSRVLVALPIKAGDVIETKSYLKGDGNRVDLSCGRIDVWSGPPLLGPAPGPGTPGDCRL
jgi:hypothetical protein